MLTFFYQGEIDEVFDTGTPVAQQKIVDAVSAKASEDGTHLCGSGCLTAFSSNIAEAESKICRELQCKAP
jgi:7-keto-8-aminopelargonate synthetase-like enzyme